MESQKSKVKRQNRKLKFKILLLFTSAFNFYLFTFTFCISHAETVSSTQLIERAKEIDGRRVTYEGEAVTAVLNRGEYSWVNLNDGYSAIGVWCETSKLGTIKFTGDYKNKGDVLKVEGVFNRACPMHGGELDIHADEIEISKSGFSVGERLDRKKLNLSILLFLVVISFIIIFRRRI